jgi:hypothetical protein
MLPTLSYVCTVNVLSRFLLYLTTLFNRRDYMMWNEMSAEYVMIWKEAEQGLFQVTIPAFVW